MFYNNYSANAFQFHLEEIPSKHPWQAKPIHDLGQKNFSQSTQRRKDIKEYEAYKK